MMTTNWLQTLQESIAVEREAKGRRQEAERIVAEMKDAMREVRNSIDARCEALDTLGIILEDDAVVLRCAEARRNRESRRMFETMDT